MHEFRNTTEDRQRFMAAVADWTQSDETLPEFFRQRFEISENTIYSTAKRLGVAIPTNRNHDRRAVIEKQNRHEIPIELLAHDYRVTVQTLRQWASNLGMGIEGGSQWKKRRWWRTALEPVRDDLENAFEHLKEAGLPPHLAIPKYHAIFDPAHPICWDLGPPPCVVIEWNEDDYAEALNATLPTAALDAELFIGKGKHSHACVWIAKEE